MQSGKAVVVTAIAGIDDYVTAGKDAILVAPGNVDDLKAKLTFLLENPRKRNELGTAARLTFEKSFNSKAFAEQLFDILTAACHDIWSTGRSDQMPR
jgi:glycosyltransferase involved in cell wall biosynthesis